MGHHVQLLVQYDPKNLDFILRLYLGTQETQARPCLFARWAAFEVDEARLARLWVTCIRALRKHWRSESCLHEISRNFPIFTPHRIQLFLTLSLVL
jgi:hypothetical protein